MQQLKSAIFFLVLLLSCVTALFAQDGNKRKPYPDIFRQKGNEMLYATTDKTIYTAGEIIWFSVYFLEITPIEREGLPDVVSVAIMRQDTSGFAVKKNYLMKAGLCAGSLTLPDSIPAGDYTLVVIGNILHENGDPKYTYQTSIKIRSLTVPTLLTSFNLTKKTGKEVTITSKVWSTTGEALNNRKSSITYKLSTGFSGKATLDVIGRSTISIPVHELEGSDRILYTVTDFNGQKKFFNYKIPLLADKKVTILTSIDNTILIAEQEYNVFVKCATQQGRPVMMSLELLEEGMPICTVSVDRNGDGAFSFIPQYGKKYALRRADAPEATEHIFSSVSQRGANLFVAEPMVADTIRAIVLANADVQVKIEIQDVANPAARTGLLDIKYDKLKRILVPFSESKSGLSKIVLKTADNEVLDRKYVFKANDKAFVEIDTYGESFGTREKVELHVAVKDRAGKALGGVYTVYCVATTRVDSLRKPRMPDYYFLDYWSKVSIVDKGSLQHTLLLNNFDTELGSFISSPTTRLSFKGHIKGLFHAKDKQKMKHPPIVLTRRDAGFNMISADNLWEFYPTPGDIVTKEGRSLFMYASYSDDKMKRKSDEFEVKLVDPMKDVMEKVEKALFHYHLGFESPAIQSDTSVVLKNLPYNFIEEVTVYAKPGQVRRDRAVNECGDYVCMYNVLNCQNHPFEGRPAVKGERYKTNGIDQVYTGCVSQYQDQASLYTAMDFQGMSAADLDESTGATFLSTILWKPFVTVADGGHIREEFYTSDLPGRYKIIIEGVTSAGDLIYKEAVIQVKKTAL